MMILLLLHKFVYSLPKATLALAILAFTSSSITTFLERALPRPLTVDNDVGFNLRLAWWWLVHRVYLFCADREAEVVADIGEPVNALLHVGLGSSVEGAIIGEQKVVDGVRLNLGLRLQSPEVEDGAVKTPSDADSDVHAFKCISQHGGEHQAEERWDENTTLLDFIGDKERL